MEVSRVNMMHCLKIATSYMKCMWFHSSKRIRRALEFGHEWLENDIQHPFGAIRITDAPAKPLGSFPTLASRKWVYIVSAIWGVCHAVDCCRRRLWRYCVERVTNV